MAVLHNGQQRRLKRALQREKHPSTRLRIQMVVLRHNGLTQPEIAEVTGKSLSTVNRAHMAYARGGIKALQVNPSGGRINQHMTVKAEKGLLDRFAQAAGAGELLNIDEMHAAYEQAIGHPTSKSTMYHLLARHGWRNLMPRPHHPKRDLAAQQRFKKKTFPPRSGTHGERPLGVAAA